MVLNPIATTKFYILHSVMIRCTFFSKIATTEFYILHSVMIRCTFFSKISDKFLMSDKVLISDEDEVFRTSFFFLMSVKVFRFSS